MTSAAETGTQLVVSQPEDRAILRAAPGDVGAAVEDYRKIQQALDKAMPDCLMTIQGKQFRKKNYWRAIATAFNLTVTLKNEQRIDQENDWGWTVIYNAAASNGRSADGDGSCFASEKRVYLWRNGCRTNEIDEEKTAIAASVHNIRSHAHTRAYNRAVSNLVGFGEVSAEEMPHESSQSTYRSSTPADRTITAKQRTRLYAIGNSTAGRLNVPAEQVDEWAKAFMRQLGFDSSMQLTREPYDTLCNKLETMTLSDLANVPGRGEEPSSTPNDEQGEF